MKTLVLSLLSFIVITAVSAQEAEEWTTYYAEEVGFQIDMPDSWTVGFAEERSKLLPIYQAAIHSFSTNETHILILLTMNYKPKVVKGFAPPIDEDLRFYRKRAEKGAKKENDQAFRWIGEGKDDFHIDKSIYGWLEYIETLTTESGDATVRHKKELFIYLPGTPKYRISIAFSSEEDKWDEGKEILDRVVSSIQLYNR